MGHAAADRVPGGSVADRLAGDGDRATARSEAGDHLGQLGLAVAGDGGDPDDLASVDIQRDASQGRQEAVVVGRDVGGREDDGPGFERSPH